MTRSRVGSHSRSFHSVDRAVGRAEGLTVFGPVNDTMREMVAGLTYTYYDSYAAGFAR